jgi:hypothetical protein
MNKTWLKRIERLEVIARLRTPRHAVFRFGYLRTLPADTGTERHVVTTNTEPTALANVERCDFEERLGPAPGPTQDLTFTVYLRRGQAHDSSPSP